MTSWELLQPYLPSPWVAALAALPPEEGDRVQEIRLRADSAVTVSLPQGERYLTPQGLTTLRQSDGFGCSRGQLESCFVAFCQESVYAHQWELAQGYIAVPGGIRVGVAGTAVLSDGGVTSVRQVTALCVRLPRRLAGCARPLLPMVLDNGIPVSTVLVGPPSCGKTTLLRDLAAQLALSRRRVTVVDERGELVAEGALQGCDVLRGYPKAVGVRQAVRCLAPEFVLLDELGDEAEMGAVADCAHAGVAVVATLHGYDPVSMARQPFVAELVRRGVFSQWVFLQGRSAPGQIRHCYIPEVTPYGVDWRPVVGGGGNGDGSVCLPPSAETGGVFGDVRTCVANPATADAIFCPADERIVATIGAE